MSKEKSKLTLSKATEIEKVSKSELTFRLDITPPTSTGQMKKYTRTKYGKTVVYEDPKAKRARQLLCAALKPFVPEEKMRPPIRLDVSWYFPITGKHRDGEWKTTKPDTDNLSKILKDEMSRLGFWNDDKEVVHETIRKFFSNTPGILIRVEEM